MQQHEDELTSWECYMEQWDKLEEAANVESEDDME